MKDDGDTLLRQDGGVIYHFAPPVMRLLCKNFSQNSLRCAAPPTPEQPDFAESKPRILCPGGTQNPSVLLSPEMVCSVRQHPLSGTSGRKRYNTLDFASKIVCQQGAFTPIGNPEVKEPAVPLQSQPVLKSVYTNRENGVCIYTFQNEKIPTVDPPIRRGKTVGIFYAAFIGTGEIHASPTAAALQFSEHSSVFRRKQDALILKRCIIPAGMNSIQQ